MKTNLFICKRFATILLILLLASTSCTAIPTNQPKAESPASQLSSTTANTSLPDDSVEVLPLEQEVQLLLWDSYLHTIKLGVEHVDDDAAEVYLELDGIRRTLEESEQIGSAFLIRKNGGRTFLLLDVDLGADNYCTMIFEFASGRLIQVDATDPGMRIDPDNVQTDRVALRIRTEGQEPYSASKDYEITSNGELVELTP